MRRGSGDGVVLDRKKATPYPGRLRHFGNVTEECRKVEMTVEDVRLCRTAVVQKKSRGRKAKAAVAAITEDAVLTALKTALLDVSATVEVREVVERLGVVAARLKGSVDALMTGGFEKCPRTVVRAAYNGDADRALF